MKIQDDKYYTPTYLAKELIHDTFEILLSQGINNVSEIIEPSAGNGSFSKLIPCIAYDINPEADNIIQADFLTLDLEYKKGRLFIGNPPFGVHNSLSIKFYKKCCELGDYIAFIQPISQLNNTLTLYYFDLIYSKDLGEVLYSNCKLHCCFNIYIRPKSGKLNEKPDYKLEDVEIKEYRRNGSYKPPTGYDFGICAWGNGCFGKIPEYVGQYAQELYFYIHREDLKDLIYELLKSEEFKTYIKAIASKKISVARMYKFLKEHITGIK